MLRYIYFFKTGFQWQRANYPNDNYEFLDFNTFSHEHATAPRFSVAFLEDPQPGFVELEIRSIDMEPVVLQNIPLKLPEDACVYINTVLGGLAHEINSGFNAKVVSNISDDRLHQPDLNLGGNPNKLYLEHIRGMEELDSKPYLWEPDNTQLINGLMEIDLYEKLYNINDLPYFAPVDNQFSGVYDKASIGNIYFAFNVIEGLNHLVGETIGRCINGNAQDPMILENNSYDIAEGAFSCVIGLQYKSWIKTLPFSGGAMIGSSVGLVGQQRGVILHLYNSLGGRYGATADITFPIPYSRAQVNIIDVPQEPFSGILNLAIPQSDIYNRTIYVEHNDPTNFSLLAVTQDVIVSDA